MNWLNHGGENGKNLSFFKEEEKMFNAKTVKSFLSNEECEKLVNFATSIDRWEDGGSEFWNNRSLNASTIYDQYDKEIGTMLYETREKIKNAIQSLYGLSAVYPDLIQIVRWFPGMEQAPHADDMTDHDDPELEWFRHRDYGAIIYLNDNYEGGETYYPQHNQFIKPEAGKLAIHPGTPDHMHGVTEIKDSIRYTIASFWTTDKGYADGWTIH
jgi:hypothetical protein